MHNMDQDGTLAEPTLDASVPFAFTNDRLAPCKGCGDIHDYITRGCMPVIVFGPDEADRCHTLGTPVLLDRLPRRWRLFEEPADRVYDREGRPVG